MHHHLGLDLVDQLGNATWRRLAQVVMGAGIKS
jgi:hypothetical protein